MQHFEILYDRRSADVEEVFADAEVPGTSTLTPDEMGEAVFHVTTLAHLLPSLRGLDELAESLLQWLVLADADGPSGAGTRSCALLAQLASCTHGWVELRETARLDVLSMAAGACDGQLAHVEAEVRLGECTAMDVARHPRLRQHLTFLPQQLVDHGTVDVAAIDMELRDAQALVLDVRLEVLCSLLFREIGRRYGARQDESGIQVGCDVPLVAIERLDLLLRPWRISGSSIETRRSGATPWRFRFPPDPGSD